jgi:hypothetical protein
LSWVRPSWQIPTQTITRTTRLTWVRVRVVGGFTLGNTSFLVMNPDFHFALAMDVIVCTTCVGNDLRKNIVSVFYGIQCSLNNFELSATIMTNSNPDHNTSASKTVGLVHTLIRKLFPTHVVHTITSIEPYDNGWRHCP